MIQVHAHRNVRELFNSGQNHVLKEVGTSVFASPSRSLHDDRAIGFVRGLHNGAHLFQIVNVKGRDAITILGGMVE